MKQPAIRRFAKGAVRSDYLIEQLYYWYWVGRKPSKASCYARLLHAELRKSDPTLIGVFSSLGWALIYGQRKEWPACFAAQHRYLQRLLWLLTVGCAGYFDDRDVVLAAEDFLRFAFKANALSDGYELIDELMKNPLMAARKRDLQKLKKLDFRKIPVRS